MKRLYERLKECSVSSDFRHGLVDIYGMCPWCGRVVDEPKTDIILAYEYFYDPNFGSDRRDVY